MRTLLLIDANSIIHRAFHALPPFTAPASAEEALAGKPGRPTGALYGLASILLKLFREERPDYAAALFDRPELTFRKEKYREYKAQRPPAPDALISQIIEARNLFQKFGVRTFEAPSFEADDLIATLAERFRREPELQIVILTGDKDTLQLVEGEKVVVRTFNKGVSDTTTYNEKMVEEKYGLKPVRLTDYKALVGDPSDNIKGVPGVGPKTATELLRRFGDLETIFKKIGTDPKLRKLEPFRKEAELARELVVLHKDAPIVLVELEDFAAKDKPEEIKDYFLGLGFGSLLRRMEEGMKAKKPARKKEKRGGGGKDNGKKQNTLL